MAVTVVPLTSSLGARVEGVQLASVDDAETAAIREALHRYGVLVLPEQRLDRDQQVEFTARLGPVHGHPVPEFLFGGADPVSIVENDGDKLPQDDQHFHVDYSFAPEIPDLAVLPAPRSCRRPVATPCGRVPPPPTTALSPRMQEFLDGLTTRRRGGRPVLVRDAPRAGLRIRRASATTSRGSTTRSSAAHPVTGRRLLFVNPGYTVAITELSTRESEGLLRLLFDHLNNPAFHFRHRWHESDVVIWDEHLTAHIGPFDFAPHHRRLARVTAGRTAPAA